LRQQFFIETVGYGVLSYVLSSRLALVRRLVAHDVTRGEHIFAATEKPDDFMYRAYVKSRVYLV